VVKKAEISTGVMRERMSRMRLIFYIIAAECLVTGFWIGAVCLPSRACGDVSTMGAIFAGYAYAQARLYNFAWIMADIEVPDFLRKGSKLLWRSAIFLGLYLLLYSYGQEWVRLKSGSGTGSIFRNHFPPDSLYPYAWILLVISIGCAIAAMISGVQCLVHYKGYKIEYMD
jgi:hypothetical protein